ncbi:hypothetical protein [Pedococcus sp. 5OH_020]|nr:hypothetical protein [Pedococcus sp. 5OH_020]
MGTARYVMTATKAQVSRVGGPTRFKVSAMLETVDVSGAPEPV